MSRVHRLGSSLVIAITACAGCSSGGARQVETCVQPSVSADSLQRLDANQVVARWDGGEATYGEVFAARRGALRKLKNEYLKKRHEVEQGALEVRINEALLTRAADKAGQSLELFLKSIVDSAPPVTTDDVRQFYLDNVARIGRPFEQVHDQIQNALQKEQHRQAVSTVVQGLQSEANLILSLARPALIAVEFDLTNRPHKGRPGAPVTIVEFADFECPFCAKMGPAVQALVDAYPNDVVVYFLHFPLRSHPGAMPAAIASHCAHKQGQFWAFHDRLFDGSAGLTVDFFRSVAHDLEMDIKALDACLVDPVSAQAVEADRTQGINAGIGGTPAFFINGVPYDGVPDPAAIPAYLTAAHAAR